MKTKEFIEKAIEGGWKKEINTVDGLRPEQFTIEYVVMDPKAWEAVGRVEGWDDDIEDNIVYCRGDHQISKPKDCFDCYEELTVYKDYMHQMIDHLVSGGTIESYLETL